MYEICDPMTGETFLSVRSEMLARLICWLYSDLGIDYARSGEGWL